MELPNDEPMPYEARSEDVLPEVQLHAAKTLFRV